MPLTQLDPHAALIVIDLQKGVVAIPLLHPAHDIVRRAADLARAFRKRGLPVVLVHVTGRAPGRTDAGMAWPAMPPDWSELVPELGQSESDHVVTKQRVGAFLGTDLDHYLRQRGVTQLFVVGISTSMGVESTARSAHDLGYNVVIVTDAVTDRDAEMHRHAVERLFPRMAETETTERVLHLLA